MTQSVLESYGELSAEFLKESGHTAKEMNPVARAFTGEAEESRSGLIILGPIGTCSRAKEVRKEFIQWLERRLSH